MNWNDGSVNDLNEYNCEGVLIRETDPWYTEEYRRDLTVSRTEMFDGSYTIHNLNGSIQKSAQADGPFHIYFWDETGRFLARIYFDAEEKRDFHQIQEENIALDSEGNLYRMKLNGNENCVYTVCKHDAEGNLLARETLTSDQYTP